LKKSKLVGLLQGKIDFSPLLSNGKILVELQRMAATHGISTMNKPKGLLQILWEQSWINLNENLNIYVKEKRQHWLDAHGNVCQSAKMMQKFYFQFTL